MDTASARQLVPTKSAARGLVANGFDWSELIRTVLFPKTTRPNVRHGIKQEQSTAYVRDSMLVIVLNEPVFDRHDVTQQHPLRMVLAVHRTI